MSFSGEEAVDVGGPRREYFRLLMSSLKNLGIFQGSWFSHDLHLLCCKKYELGRKLVSWSVLQGGSGPKRLSQEGVNMAMHVTKTCSAAFFHLHNIRQIRKFLSHEATETLIHAFVTSKVDYCNSLLYGLPAYQIAKLQRVQNAAACLIFKESRFCHINPLLRQLHWLPVHYRIIFKILLIAFKAIRGLAPEYISCLVCIWWQGIYNLRSHKEITAIYFLFVSKQNMLICMAVLL